MAARRQLRTAVSAGLAVLLAAAGGTLTWAALRGPGSPPPVPGSAHADVRATPRPDPSPAARSPRHRSPTPSPPAGSSGVADRISGPTLPESRPIRLAIPRLGVRTSLVRLGVDPDGAMEVPQDPDMAGWYDLGPSPGELGPAVIAGHVTWNRPAVFYRLGTMRPGDRVAVVRSDGLRAVFKVTRVARFGKAAFPTKAVYGAIDHAGLRLITCGGTYDESAHRYLDNVVVFANLVAAQPAATGRG